jgi:hypothetical protein
MLSSGSALGGSGGKGFGGAVAAEGGAGGAAAGTVAVAAGTTNDAGSASATGASSPSGGTAPGGASAGQASANAGTATRDATAGTGGAEPEIEQTLELVDDMEDDDAFVSTGSIRNGHWDVSNDASVGATQTPAAASFTMAELVDATRPSSHFTAYTKGGGFKTWGAFMTVSMRTWPSYEVTPTYDASAYSGISFYAKAGAGSDLVLRVRYISAQTDARGRQCTPGGSVDTACYDHFYADATLTQAWQRIDLPFSKFHQAGVGKAFAAIDLSEMYALEFLCPGRKTATGNAFELWVDDLSFVVR